MSRRHIAIFLPTLHGGGAERVLLDLAQEFLRVGHRVDLVLMHATRSPLMSLVPAGVRVVDLKHPRLWTSAGALVRYLRVERPEGLLAAMPLANAIAAYARAISGVPVRLVLSEHNARSMAFGDVDAARYRVLVPFIRFGYRFADCIVAVSQGVAACLAELPGVAPAKIRVVYNAAYSPRIEQLAAEPAPHSWLDDPAIPVVIGSGRLEAQKDFATLLKAFALLKRERPARLMILGEGSERAELERLATELGVEDDVAFPGFVLNPWTYMSRARVFALSSRHEGLGNVLIESLAVGTPVVSTDCPAGPAEILENGLYGALVPVGDAAALARALAQTLDGPVRKDRLRDRARTFSIDAAAAGYLGALGFGH